jgi:predicted site-specific integrase-resolvase
VPQLVTGRTVVRLVGIHISTLHRWVNAGRVRAYTVEGVGTPRYDVEAVRAVADGEANLDIAA